MREREREQACDGKYREVLSELSVVVDTDVNGFDADCADTHGRNIPAGPSLAFIRFGFLCFA